MAAERDFHFLRVEDKPAAIAVDLALDAKAPIAELGGSYDGWGCGVVN